MSVDWNIRENGRESRNIICLASHILTEIRESWKILSVPSNVREKGPELRSILSVESNTRRMDRNHGITCLQRRLSVKRDLNPGMSCL